MNESVREQVGPRKLADQVVRILAREIIAESGQAGFEAPTEREICERHGVSKTVAREVTARMQSMGIVRIHHGKRMEVRSPDEWNYFDAEVIALLDEASLRRLVGELHDARLLIEPEAAARAARIATEAEIALMRAEIDGMRENVDRPDSFLEHDIGFHSRLIATAGNRVLRHIIDSIGELSRASRRQTNQLTGGVEHALADHEAILLAIEERKPARARDLMLKHLLWPADAYELPQGALESVKSGAKR